ncbi:gamma-glutamylcyclotransferase [Pelagibacterium luteolum]|uniref:glutathione-specific gamma-glutamylcyclotransferase n=1 Tax=Pelagibacterium luteolum TaxID=440168 RepID=A0A1G7RQM2_9HYPH|nr:gamma-glutamylcyclotransferase [Pelagibacterium luteolum]SDG13041.1 cation transport protein ChaC [Pelagibacterium luteolum]
MSSSPDSSTQWVFGYGSLIWRPGFAFVTAERALLRGVHRRLCIYSHRHRGTAERPGLVFGLERGGACVGMAFEVAADDWSAVREYLREREQVTGVYLETRRPIRLASGQTVPALTFVADPHHSQYAGRLSLEEQFALVNGAVGQAGPNIDYVINTADHLRDIGIADRQVQALAEMIRTHQGAI